MRIDHLMTCAVWTCRPLDPLDRAARIMRDYDCGSLVVVDDLDRPTAMITDRDICLCALQLRRPLHEIRVSEAMSREVHVCRYDDEVASAQAIMAQRRVRRLPVVDRAGGLVGLLSLDDIARVSARDPAVSLPPVTPEEVGRTLGSLARPRVPPARS